jgi:Ca-activated chloride channel family protein
MRHAAFAFALTLAPPAAAQEVREVPPNPAGYLAPLLDPGAAECLREVRTTRRDLPGGVAPAPAAPVQLRRLVLAVDASASMAGPIGGETRMEAARRAAADFLAGVPGDVEVALLVFGHRGSAREEGRAQSCRAAEVLVPPGSLGRVEAALGALRPVGWTPLAAAIAGAAALFEPDAPPGSQVLTVISDGVETCDGDPVAAARALQGGAARVVVNIVGLDIAEAERAALEAVAEAGGGRFWNTRSRAELARDLEEARLANTRRATQARIAAARDTTEARLSAARAVTQARICIARTRTNETVRLSRQALADRLPEETARQARAQLDRRHAALGAALDAYVAAGEGAPESRLAEIDRELEAALAPPR